jgi:hypothetical protein
VQRAWYPNLDADREFGTRGTYQSSQKLLAQAAAQRCALQLLTQGERLLEPSQPATPLQPMPDVVLCWSPTPSALRWLGARGASTTAAPPLHVLKRVNHRHFVFELEVLPGRYRFEPHDLQSLAEKPPDGARGWRLKRSFGFAGKGQRVVRWPLTADDERWLQDSLREGPLLCEPNFELEAEFSAHGYVDERGLIAGAVCQQVCDAWGQVVSIERASPAPEIARALLLMQARLAEALLGAGYFGPFGFDAYLYRGANGPKLNPLSDVNARFSLGWSVGMGQQREVALQRAVG